MHIWSEIALAVLTQAFYNFKISEAVAFYQAVLVQIEIGTNLQIPVRFGRVPKFAMSYCVWICTVAKSRWLFWLGCRLAELVTTCKIFSNRNPNTLLVSVMYTNLMRTSNFRF